jgi:hypothetical protein
MLSLATCYCPDNNNPGPEQPGLLTMNAEKAFEQLRAKNELMVSTTLKVGNSVLRATISPMASADGNGAKARDLLRRPLKPKASRPAMNL